MSYQSTVLADGATHYWRLGEPSGTSAADSVGGVTGTISASGVTKGLTGAVGGDTAMRFAGDPGRITVPFDLNVLAAGSVSIECWVRVLSVPGASASGVILDTGSNSGFWLTVRGSDGRIYFAAGENPPGAYLEFSTAPTIGVFHHVVGVINRASGLMALYKDGTLVASGAAPGVDFSSDNGVLILGSGNYVDPSWIGVNGDLDEVAIYPHALSAFQIANHYAIGLAPYVPATPAVMVTIAGVNRTADVRITNSAIQITDLLDQQPNTAQLRTWRGAKPATGAEIKIGLGGVSTLDQLLFAGHIREVTQIYEGDRPANIAYDLSCIDYTWLLTRRKVIKAYPSQSATTTVLDLMTNFTFGFTTGSVVAGLPTIEALTFTNDDVDDALTRIARLVGGYWYVDYLKVLHFFLTEATGNPVTIATASPQGAADILHQLDLSQIRTRVYVEGGGAGAAAEIPVGSNKLYVDDPAWYASGGGTVVAGAQRITYTGKSTTVVTPGTPLVEPNTNCSVTVPNGSGNLAGAYKYKYTFHNGTGETIGSPASSTVTPAAPTAPNGGVVTISDPGTAGTLVGSYTYKFTYVTALGETLLGAASGTATPDAPGEVVALSTIPTAPASAGVLARRIYRTKAGGSEYFLVDQISNNTTTTYTDNIADTQLVTHGPLVNTAGGQTVSLSSIDTGGAGTTSRRIYRTKAGGSAYFYLDSIEDNTTTTYGPDNKPDDSLGSPIPTVNDSGGQAETLTTLTGVPTSGAGSVLYAIPKGESINILAIRNDTTAQTALAALVGGDGIHEHYIQDTRLGKAEAEARGDAELAAFKSPMETVTLTTRDPNARAGKAVTLALTAPTSIAGTYKIQSVRISEVGLTSAYPLRAITASSQRYSLEELLRVRRLAS